MKVIQCLSIVFIHLLISLPAQSQVPADIQAYRAEQKGGNAERREGTLDGNQVRTLFYNDGEIGKWPYQPSGEWPRGTGHLNLDGYCVLIAARVTAPGNGQVIHPLITSYREEMDRDPFTGEIWGLEPVPGYRDASSMTPAMSNKPTSWPSAWGGQWRGMEGPGVLNATLETYFVMDDSKDAEFSRAPYSYYPVLTDSGRKGLGLRVEARGFQWADSIARDIILFRYDVVNLSDFDYDSTIFGVFVDPGIGGIGSTGNSAHYDNVQKVISVWNPSGVGVPGEYPTSCLGIVFLETPVKTAPDSGSIGLSSFSTSVLQFKSTVGAWPKNDEVMWSKMTGGVTDTAAQDTNISIIAAIGSFALKRWAREQFSVALVFADSVHQLFSKAATAREIAARGYHLPGTTAVERDALEVVPEGIKLEQNYPNPFNPTTVIRYQMPAANQVHLTVYDLLGRLVATLVNEWKEAGVHEVKFSTRDGSLPVRQAAASGGDASGLASGMYIYRLQMGTSILSRRMMVLK